MNLRMHCKESVCFIKSIENTNKPHMRIYIFKWLIIALKISEHQVVHVMTDNNASNQHACEGDDEGNSSGF